MASSEDEKYSEYVPTPKDHSQTAHNRSSVLAAETPRSQGYKDSIAEGNDDQDDYDQNEDNYSEDQESEKKYSSAPG